MSGRNLFIAFFILISGISFSQSTQEYISWNKDSVFVIPEKMAEYPGGIDALMKYLQTNIRYPAKMREQNIQGKVFASFVVSETGQISNITILKSPHQELSDEATRVISAMPEWKPAMQKEIPVKMLFNLPINFILRTAGQPDSTAIRKYEIYKEGKSLYENKEYDKAILKLEECISTPPVGDDVYLLCAKSYLELNNVSKACEYLAKVSGEEVKTAKKLIKKHCGM